MHVDLTAGWFPALLGTLTVVGAVGTFFLVRKRRGWQGWCAAGLTAVLAVATGAALVNSHYGYYRSLSDIVGDDGGGGFPDGNGGGPHPLGGVVLTTIPGTESGVGSYPAMVYLPPQHWSEPKRAFPVVYLIHGTPGAPDNIFEAGQAAAGGLAAAVAGNPVIIVAPTAGPDSGSDTECVDGAQGNWETYLTQDVVAAVDKTYRTIAAREDRAIGGLSMGGYCGLNLGLRHRDTYSTIIDLSGETRPTYDDGMRALFGNVPNLDAVVADNSPRTYAARLSSSPPMRLWLDCGTSDADVLQPLLGIAGTLRSRGFDVMVKERSGGHSWSVWRAAMAQSVPWAAARMPQDGR
jgi:S-formylglutathione hydrolase FrmB